MIPSPPEFCIVPKINFNPKPPRLILWLAIAAAIFGAVIWKQLSAIKAPLSPIAAKKSIVKPLGVTALGRLLPAGDVRRLAAPSGAMGTMPRIAELHVEVGDKVAAGALLASFDSKLDSQADIAFAKSSIGTLLERQKLLRQELARYRKLQQLGATSLEGVELRQLKLLEIDQELRNAQAELNRQNVKLPFTVLRAPFAGTILQVHARSGERPGARGVVDIGQSSEMEAELEVYESDIDRVRIGQLAKLRSENGGFSGQLNGRVFRIDPQVRQREVLSTDPTADTDARVVIVRISLDNNDRKKVANLSGLKVIGNLNP